MTVILVGGTGANFNELGIVRMHAKDLKAQGLVGIALRVRGRQAQSANNQNVWHLIRELGCEGTGLRETYIRATGTDPPPTSQDYYLDVINARLSGRNRIIVQDIGQASEGAARSHARRLLQTVVDHGVEREYEIVSQLPSPLPALGDTVIIDDYTGVVGDLSWDAAGAEERLTIRLIDYTATVLQ